MYVQVGVPVLWITTTGELEDGTQQSPSLERVPVDAQGVLRQMPTPQANAFSWQGFLTLSLGDGLPLSWAR